ncbi:hypothetical protein JHD49_11285 [Sulfurimonas sp. SAG-AH-194-C21]|nr:hypothetical protein [Sulfurimonas sp. SAG-AH-194-C21]MDF1884523.1 hypothetical protein [Sulfurimonas sp. SAG-AH-194-C21]
MTDLEISNMLDIPSNTIADWSKTKSKRYKLYTFLSKMNLDEAETIHSRKNKTDNKPRFNKKAKTVKLDKSWFYTDLLWSSGNGQRIGINRIISIYMSSPEQRNTDSLIKLFGADRIETVINENFDFDNKTKSVKATALEQVHYGFTPIKIENRKNLVINTEKLSKQLTGASQKRIDSIVSKVGKSTILEAAHRVKFPESYIIEDKIEYAIGKIV